MTKCLDATGKNEALAIAAGLEKLGMERDDVSVEVLERAKSGFLGIGASPAKVRLSYEVPDEPKPSTPVESKPETAINTPPNCAVQEPRPVQTPKQDVAENVIPEPILREDGSEDIEGHIVSFLNGLMEQMDVVARLTIENRFGDGYYVMLEGEKLGTLIGHRGETLDAVQQITNYAVNRTRSRRVRIHLDVEGYRAKREESLRHLALSKAEKVVKYRRNITLEPMNAYERHVIHEALQDVPDIETYSTGVEPNRRTVVAYSKK
ncbi:MAG: RNA-binding cell elongation regulator Jag/EloR [Evtepia sp.]